MPLNLPDRERLVYQEGRAPAAHLDLLHAAGFRAAGAAQRLGVFDTLAEHGPQSAKGLAARLRCDQRALTILARVLVDFGYLTESVDDGTDAVWDNTPASAAFLSDGTPDTYALVFSFWQRVLFDHWDRLEETVRSGTPAADFYRWLEEHPDTLREFQTMLTRQSRMLAPELIDLVPVPAGPARLLDVGGGHAGYSVAFCRRHPQLRATVLDLAGALATGTQAIGEAGLVDRIVPYEWDILSPEPIPGPPADVVLLFNIVHGYRPEQNARLLRRVVAATAPGGTVALVEPVDDPAPAGSVSGDAFVKLFSLNLLHGQGGQAYPYGEIAGWLREVGLVDVRQAALTASPNDRLILATRPVAG
ncbi:methyltransferase [Solwaraspora sp. WMMD406]|uniref:methyltransferase n=1 Tax=Solwaraspora sp. WMMD406 TaxID=3016095 RepID=UPI002415CFB1|nr:methyltransferase [Solwaraspora sp. WMMD406]MDG4765167.1 methyltransferase [Solwaraspora sp. WMMD406]